MRTPNILDIIILIKEFERSLKRKVKATICSNSQLKQALTELHSKKEEIPPLLSHDEDKKTEEKKCNYAYNLLTE